MNIKKTLQLLFEDEESHKAVYGYDIIGDILILSLSEQLHEKTDVLAHEILKNHSALRLVCLKTAEHNGEYRTTTLQRIGGQGDCVTLHKEFGLRLRVEPDKVYFSPRSGNERNRIARLVQEGERVLVMFSGIGPLPLMIGSNAKIKEIIGVEKNPDAHRLACENLKINPIIENVFFIQGDVRTVVPNLSGEFDRIVMPLPFSGETFLPLALRKLKRSGFLHFYDIQHLERSVLAEEKVVSACQQEARDVLRINTTRCGHVGSKTFRLCVDAHIF